jgi:hypothetical protein
LLGLFQIPNYINLGFSLLENNLAVQINENITNIYFLLPSTDYANIYNNVDQSYADFSAQSNIPNSNSMPYWPYCGYTYTYNLIKNPVDYWSFFP